MYPSSRVSATRTPSGSGSRLLAASLRSNSSPTCGVAVTSRPPSLPGQLHYGGTLCAHAELIGTVRFIGPRHHWREGSTAVRILRSVDAASLDLLSQRQTQQCAAWSSPSELDQSPILEPIARSSSAWLPPAPRLLLPGGAGTGLRAGCSSFLRVRPPRRSRLPRHPDQPHATEGGGHSTYTPRQFRADVHPHGPALSLPPSSRIDR